MFINFHFVPTPPDLIRESPVYKVQGSAQFPAQLQKFLKIKFKYKNAFLVQRVFFVCVACFVQTIANMFSNKTAMRLECSGFLATHLK